MSCDGRGNQAHSGDRECVPLPTRNNWLPHRLHPVMEVSGSRVFLPHLERHCLIIGSPMSPLCTLVGLIDYMKLSALLWRQVQLLDYAHWLCVVNALINWLFSLNCLFYSIVAVSSVPLTQDVDTSRQPTKPVEAGGGGAPKAKASLEGKDKEKYRCKPQSSLYHLPSAVLPCARCRHSIKQWLNCRP